MQQKRLCYSKSKIVGSWNVVSDSTFAAGIDAPNNASVSNKYSGVSGDYFTFTNDHVYIKENTVETYTAIYSIAKDTLKMVYAHLKKGISILTNASMNYLITTSNPHSLILKSTGLISPAGEFSEVITLAR